jgi:hypothetical protein
LSNVAARKRGTHVVVGGVAILLQIDKRHSDGKAPRKIKFTLLGAIRTES